MVVVDQARYQSFYAAGHTWSLAMTIDEKCRKVINMHFCSLVAPAITDYRDRWCVPVFR